MRMVSCQGRTHEQSMPSRWRSNLQGAMIFRPQTRIRTEVMRLMTRAWDSSPDQCRIYSDAQETLDH